MKEDLNKALGDPTSPVHAWAVAVKGQMDAGRSAVYVDTVQAMATIAINAAYLGQHVHCQSDENLLATKNDIEQAIGTLMYATIDREWPEAEEAVFMAATSNTRRFFEALLKTVSDQFSVPDTSAPANSGHMH